MRKFSICKSSFACCVLLSLLSFVLASCEDDNVGEYKLTGNIESLIPSSSYNVSGTTKAGSDGTQYLVVTPTLDDNFEYWGLTVKDVKYYIDGELAETVNASPYDLVYNISGMKAGTHEFLVKITIQGEECEDVVLEKSGTFTASSSGSTTSSSVAIYFDYNYVCKGETFQLTPYILEERSPENSKITKVEYYWDDKLVATKTQSPFTWEYPVTDEAGTSHSVKAVIQYSYGNSTGSYSWYFGTYTIMDDDGSRYWWKRKLADNDNIYQNGETVESVAKCYKGKDNKDTYSFKLYYDGKQIGESSTFPYEIDYKLVNQSTGSHTFKSEWTVKKSDGSTQTSSSESTIVIIP